MVLVNLVLQVTFTAKFEYTFSFARHQKINIITTFDFAREERAWTKLVDYGSLTTFQSFKLEVAG